MISHWSFLYSGAHWSRPRFARLPGSKPHRFRLRASPPQLPCDWQLVHACMHRSSTGVTHRQSSIAACSRWLLSGSPSSLGLLHFPGLLALRCLNAKWKNKGVKQQRILLCIAYRQTLFIKHSNAIHTNSEILAKPHGENMDS